MRDIALILFLFAFLGISFKRPFLFVLAYAYIDIVAPQRLSYYLLNSIPISLIVFLLAFASFMLADDKKDVRFAPRQFLLVLLLVYCGYTTSQADFPIDAQAKWAWVWKALVFAIFLPLTLRTKLRIEALSLTLVLSASAIIITGGIKTALSGGGYGVMQLLVNDDSGLYEGSIISCVAITIIPLIIWLTKHGTIFPSDWRVKCFAYALIFACLLIPIGTQARTGLVCAAVLAIMAFRFARYRVLYAAGLGLVGLMALPLLPSAFTERMETIENYQADQSASTRLAVWGWTWEFAKENPLGGGFEAYRQNKLSISRVETENFGAVTSTDVDTIEDEGRAYHSSYFEMLGEQGYPGLAMWLLLHLTGLWRMERLRAMYSKRNRPGEEWVAPLAWALLNSQLVYLVGSLFVGIAFQPFIYMLLALQISLDAYLGRRRAEAAWRPIYGGRAESRTPLAL